MALELQEFHIGFDIAVQPEAICKHVTWQDVSPTGLDMPKLKP